MLDFFKKKSSNPLEALWLKSEQQINLIESIQTITKEAEYEVHILCATIISNLSKFDKEFKKSYLKYLIDKREEFTNFSHVDAINFADQRMDYFSQEINNLISRENYLNAGIYNVIYENPLTLNPRYSSNMPQILKFKIVFNKILRNLNS